MSFSRLGRAMQTYSDPRIVGILFFGFSSGLPLALTASTLFAWLAEVGVDKTSIGIFAMLATPYSLKFLWAPIIDGTHFPVLCQWLGRRRGWLMATQILLAAAIAVMALVDPLGNVWLFGAVAFAIAFCSASQDIVIDAYRVERIEPAKQASAAALYSIGYRVAMLVSGAGALVLAQVFQTHLGHDFSLSWQMTYLAMASLMVVGIVTTVVVKEPEASDAYEAKRVARGEAKPDMAEWLRDNVVAPFADFMQRPGWFHILLFVVLFRLADAYLGVMFNPFLLELGFTKAQIAEIVKLYGMFATFVGAMVGGVLVARFGMYKTLLTCGFLHMLTNLLLIQQAYLGVNEPFLALCIITENSTAGMTSMAFIAYLSSLCRVNYTATQYALLSSLAAVGRTFLSSSSGAAAAWLGWPLFFLFSSLLAVPALVLLWYIHRRFGIAEAREEKADST
jgi:MFS transporter, PAT family, beta-lactamase induction signal transducer AmpG